MKIDRFLPRYVLRVLRTAVIGILAGPLLGLLLVPKAAGQELALPRRPADAPTGSVLAAKLAPLDRAAREAEIAAEVRHGNVPDFLRKFCPVKSTAVVKGTTRTAVFFVAPDYLAVGSDAGYLLVPLSPATAQALADQLDCLLPTRKMVDLIYKAAEVKLAPSPLPPSPAMTTIAVFAQNNALVRAQRQAQAAQHPLGALVAGDKKDVVISARLASAPGKVAIYGWHRAEGKPIQPLYLGHTASWVDYSHGIRLVHRRMTLDGQPASVADVLSNAELAGLLSDEGPLSSARYSVDGFQAAPKPKAPPAHILPQLATIPEDPATHERRAIFSLEPGVRVHVSAPAEGQMAGKPVDLVIYALPNGNTLEQTLGRKLRAGDDWHFDIQHIAAQTRFLRTAIADRALVVACLEAEQKSWPAWRKQHGDQAIPPLIAAIESILPERPASITLSGHSGGGSFIFGYLNTVAEIPDRVTRIAFLDSNYAYDKSLGHARKLATWLKGSDRHYLCILAYDDATALLNGKPFVSAAGGTWGKSHEMLRDLAADFTFSSKVEGGFERYSALAGRVQFILKQNPERKILHTVQVERNGFIHALLSGTPRQDQGYEYFGPRAYVKLIEE